MIRLLAMILSLPLLAHSAEIWAYLMQGEESLFPRSVRHYRHRAL